MPGISPTQIHGVVQSGVSVIQTGAGGILGLLPQLLTATTAVRGEREGEGEVKGYES